MGFAHQFKQTTGKQKLLFAIGFLFFLLYLSLGLLFLCYKDMPFNLSPLAKNAFGALLVVYACFRLWRLFNDLKKANRR